MEARVNTNFEQARAAVDAVLASETFARSEQMRAFLGYVCERALSGHAREINEYSVAVEALGKPSEFSPGDDSSVRRAAYELRQKLQKYYETEGHDAALRIELPKGSYTPRFVEPSTAAKPDPPAIAGERHPQRLVWILVAAVTVLAVAAVLLAVRGMGAPKRLDSEVRGAWYPLTANTGDVLVSVGSTLHLIVRPHMNIVAEGLPKYPAPPEVYPIYRSHRPLEAGAELSMHPADNSVQMGHAQTVAIVATTLSLAGVGYQILPERSVSAAALRGRNVILIADPIDSNLAAHTMEKAPLTLEYNADTRDTAVRDRLTRAVWSGKRGVDNRFLETLGLITVLPGEGESAGPHRTLVFSGITSVGAHGAAEFFSRPEKLRALRERFRGEGLAGFPAAYQVLVKCRSDDTQLLGAEYVTHRVIAR